MDYLELTRDRQVKAYKLVRDEDRIIKARREANNEHLAELFNRRPTFRVGDWVWVYDDNGAITGGRKHVLETSEADFRSKKFALTAKLAQCWTGTY